ncbi:MAG: NmrA family NAD(P)-binding protein [Steroidobacteraceae bacterium]|nr:NmrA family NAD(P)-binding protein [Steroidobacteraceae bacterium]
MIVVTGATGRTGASAALEVARRGLPVRALVRNADKAARLREAGVQLALGDVDDAAALAAALQGATKVLVCLPNGEQQLRRERAIVDAAVAAGVRHIVKISSVEALPTMHNPIHQTHWQSEQHIRATGVPWTMVRPTFYMQNFLLGAQTIKAQDRLVFPFGEHGAAALIDSRDAGWFAGYVLATDGHAQKSYDITSRDRLTFHEVAAVFSRVLGRKITYVPQDPAEFKAWLSKINPSPWHVDAVCGIFAEIAAGYAVNTTDTFRQVTGREPTSLEVFVREHAALFDR